MRINSHLPRLGGALVRQSRDRLSVPIFSKVYHELGGRFNNQFLIRLRFFALLRMTFSMFLSPIMSLFAVSPVSPVFPLV